MSRKADGHLHAPISDAAEDAERERNNELAAQFFQIASRARGISPKKIASLEAAIYLGKRAREVGLIDDVISFDDAVATLDRTAEEPAAPPPAPNEGNRTDRRAKEGLAGLSQSVSACATETEAMSVKLDAVILKTEAAIKAESDPRKLVTLRADLSALHLAKAKMEDDDEDPDKKKEPDDDKSKKAAEKAEKAKRHAEASKHRAKAAEHRQKAAESEEAAKKCEEEGGEEDDEEEKVKALRASGLSEAAAAAIAAQASLAQSSTDRVTALETKLAKREQVAEIKEALADGRITPAEAKMLGGKTPSWASEYIATREGVRVVNVEEGHLIVPDGTPHGDVPKAVLTEINERIAMMGITEEKAVEKLRGEMIENRRKVAANGAVERY